MGCSDQAKRPRLWNRLDIKILYKHHVADAHIVWFLGCHSQTVHRWVGRFRFEDSIDDTVRPGVKPKLLEETSQRVIAFFCQFETLPGYARWTLSTACQYFRDHPEYLGEEVSISRASIHRLLHAHA